MDVATSVSTAVSTKPSKGIGHLTLASSTATLISLLFIVSLQYLYKGNAIKRLEWDLSTVTVDDYTVEFEIPADAYTDWHDRIYE